MTWVTVFDHPNWSRIWSIYHIINEMSLQSVLLILHHTPQKPWNCWTPVFANLTSSNSQSLSCDSLPQTTIEEETIPTGNVALNSHASRWFIGSFVFISSPFLLVLVVFTVLAACCHGHWHGLQFHSSRRALAWKMWVCLKNRPCPKTKMCWKKSRGTLQDAPSYQGIFRQPQLP